MQKKIKVALVVGHNEIRQGAVSEKYDMTEYKFNSQLTDDIRRYIWEKSNYNSISPIRILRPNTKDGYQKLPNKINICKPDFIISFHCNSYDYKAEGTEFLYWHDSKLGEKIAYQLNYDFACKGIFYQRYIKSINSQEQRGGYLLRNTKAPCIIAETFFIDNDLDYEKAIKHYEIIVSTYGDTIINICKDLFGLKESIGEAEMDSKYGKTLEEINIELKKMSENENHYKSKSNKLDDIIESIEDLDDDYYKDREKKMNDFDDIIADIYSTFSKITKSRKVIEKKIKELQK